MARSMVSPGMLWARAARTAVRSRGLAFASPPPSRAATVISLMSLVKIFPRLASFAAFLCLMVLHLEWPDIERLRRPGGARAPRPDVSAGYHMAPQRTTEKGVALTSPRLLRYVAPQCGGDGWRCWALLWSSRPVARQFADQGRCPRLLPQSARSRKGPRHGTGLDSTGDAPRAGSPTISTI